MHVHGAPCFVPGVADIFQGALGALRFAGDAEFAAVPDDLVREQDPLLAWDNLHQVLLDLHGFVLRGQFKTARDAVNMSIDDHAFGYFKNDPSTTFAVLRATPGRVSSF